MSLAEPIERTDQTTPTGWQNKWRCIHPIVQDEDVCTGEVVIRVMGDEWISPQAHPTPAIAEAVARDCLEGMTREYGFSPLEYLGAVQA
jgi:hypothetical protein